jgi:MFS family permease
MIAAGFVVSTLGGALLLCAAHALLIGVLGTGAIHALLLVYVSRWFDRRRGTALALLASGQYVGGALWPLLLANLIATVGWRATMVVFAAVALLAIVTLALMFLRPAPEPLSVAGHADIASSAGRIAIEPRTMLGMLCLASFLCCVPMAMPPAHLIALCGDMGIAPSRGALMLSLMLAAAFVSRQFWGWLSDRIGGLETVLAASACQAAAVACFLLTQDEPGLFAVSIGFGLAFSGIIPAYILAVRDLLPAKSAGSQVSLLYFSSIVGMFAGAYGAGLVYDSIGSYGAVFAAGVAFNVANLFIIGWLVFLQTRTQSGSSFLLWSSKR